MAVAGRIGVLCAFYRLARSFYNGDIPFESVGRIYTAAASGIARRLTVTRMHALRRATGTIHVVAAVVLAVR